MKPKFCPACGKETNALFDKLCESCFREKNKFAEISPQIKIKICKNCGKTEKYNIDKLDEMGIIKIIKNNMKINGKLENIGIRKEGGKIIIKVFGFLKNKVFVEETLETKIIIKEILCETCGKVKGGYYEAVIQLRGDKDKIENTLEVLENMIRKRGVMTKIEEKKEGVNVYFTPKKILGYLIKNLPETKEIKRSYTLATKKDGKDLYRNTVLVRL